MAKKEKVTPVIESAPVPVVPQAPTIIKPTASERKSAHVMGVLGTDKGWKFESQVELGGAGKSDLTGCRLFKGVKVSNVNGKTLVMGIGEAKKFTDVQIPKKARVGRASVKTVEAGKAEDALADVDLAAVEELLSRVV